MTVTAIQNHFELCGRDEGDLITRIDNFRRAVRVQRGAILAIEWKDGCRSFTTCASIHYQIPLSVGRPSVSALGENHHAPGQVAVQEVRQRPNSGARN